MVTNMDLQESPKKGGGILFMDRPTTVDCEKEINCWISFRGFFRIFRRTGRARTNNSRTVRVRAVESVLGAAVTGTLYGQRYGRVGLPSVCKKVRRPHPLVLLEFAIPTYSLVREMSSGLLRIALECEKSKGAKDLKAGGLFAEPVWNMFCNGRKVGFAIKRQISDSDRNVLGLMQSVTMGAGVIPPEDEKAVDADEEIMYMRARYERVGGAPDSLSLHMINPDGSPGQELSIFFLRVE